MPPVGKQYTLRGFSADLDLRPLRFAEPLPPAMVCSGCGLVPKRIAFLPCGHLLCEPCHGRLEGVCPLDGDSCREQDVVWRDLSVDKLMSRQVACWNSPNGCDFVSDIPAMMRHFRDDCSCHAIDCPQCSVPVLCTALVQHLNSGCRSLVLPERASAGGGDRSQTTLSENIENIALEVKATLAQISNVSTLTEAKLRQISVTNESVETSTREALRRSDAFELGVRELAGKQERAFDVVINMLEETLSALRRIDGVTHENAERVSRLGETLDTFTATQNTTTRERTDSSKPRQSGKSTTGLPTKQEEALRRRRTSPEQVPREGASGNTHLVAATTSSISNSASHPTDPVIFVVLDVLFRFIGNTVLHVVKLAVMWFTGFVVYSFWWIFNAHSTPFSLVFSYTPVYHFVGLGCAFPWLPVLAGVGWRTCLGVIRMLSE